MNTLRYKCPDIQQLQEFFDGTLTYRQILRIKSHIDPHNTEAEICNPCFQFLLNRYVRENKLYQRLINRHVNPEMLVLFAANNPGTLSIPEQKKITMHCRLCKRCEGALEALLS